MSTTPTTPGSWTPGGKGNAFRWLRLGIVASTAGMLAVWLARVALQPLVPPLVPPLLLEIPYSEF